MKAHIRDTSRTISILDSKLSSMKDQISTLLDINMATQVKHKIHDLNQVIYKTASSTKNAKLSRLISAKYPLNSDPSRGVSSPTSSDTTSHATSSAENGKGALVHCIPDSVPLSSAERSVLSKGLNFVPLTPKTDGVQTDLLLSRFYRTLRWTATLGSPPTRQHSDDPFINLFSVSKGRLPPQGKFQSLESYISTTQSSINKLKPKPLRHSNLTDSEISALRHLRARDDIVIKPADKGGSVVVWCRQAYITEAMRQLSSTTHYKTVAKASFKLDSSAVAKAIGEEIKSSALPSSAKLLVVKQSREPRFYMLPKIHKVDSPGRPIISTCSCPTEHISQYLDSVFQPLVQALPSYIKDSTDALHRIQQINDNGSLTPKHLLTMDVVSLYTNIPHNDGLIALKEFLDTRVNLSPPTSTLLRLTELVLGLNTFEFNGHFYKQCSGVAMGTKMGPSFACLFMGYLENKIFLSYHGPIPEYYGRFIDDCVIVSSLDEVTLLDFLHFANSFHSAINFTYELSPSDITFLDIHIKLSGGLLSTSVHYKPTDTHSYLDYRSSHSSSTRNSIPFSQFLRLRRLCSDDVEFNRQARHMISFFTKRHYPLDVIRNGLERAARVPRALSLSGSTKTSTSRPIVVIPFHPHNLPIKRILLDHWSVVMDDPILSGAFPEPPLIAYKRPPNIGDSLVRSRLRAPTGSSFTASPGTRPCDKLSCKACPFLDTQTTVTGPLSSFTVKRTFICHNTNLVYVIRCTRCGQLYVGETERTLEKRFSEHLADIRLSRDYLPVAKHFCQRDHSLQDIRVQVLWLVRGDPVDRKHIESKFISKLGTKNPRGMNLKS